MATGGTALASAETIEKEFSAKIVGLAFLIELSYLNGRKILKDYDVRNVLEYSKP